MKTSEMIAMLEKNPKLLFTNSTGVTIALIPHRPNYFHSLAEPGCWKHYEMEMRDDWTLVREPVPVWETIKALTKGKAIQCEHQPDKRYLPYLSQYKPYDESANNPPCMIPTSELLHGTWFIVEDSPHG